jgi:oligoendopeptidase F
MSILDKLRGGDLRSIGRANEVVGDIEKNVSLFETVSRGLYDSDPIVRMRSADVIEKVTQNKPELLSNHTSEVISILTTAKQQEVCWHMAQIAPRLPYSPNEENEIIKALKRYLTHKSKIVRVSAMESLANIAERNRSILNEVMEIIKMQEATGSPAIQVRGRKLLKRLNVKGE